jgi:hypothetical protein
VQLCKHETFVVRYESSGSTRNHGHFENKCPPALTLFQISHLLSSHLLANETEWRTHRLSGGAQCFSSLHPSDLAGPPPRLPPPVGPRWSAPLHRRPAAPPSHLPLRAGTSPQSSSAFTPLCCTLLAATRPAYDDKNELHGDNTDSSDKNDASMNHHLTDAPMNLAFIPLNT